MQLSEHLETNLTALNARLGSSADFYAKRIELYRCRGAILLFDGMASLESLWELLLDAASRRCSPPARRRLSSPVRLRPAASGYINSSGSTRLFLLRVPR